MFDPSTIRKWRYRLIFIAVAAVLFFLHLLPTDTLPSHFPGPDLLLCLAFAWVQRRPDFVPPLLLGAVFFMADLLFMRPPGLWTALMLVGAEFLRTRHNGSTEMPFAAEMLFTASVVVAMTVAYVLVLSATGAPHAALSMYMVQMVMTILFYPVVVLLSRHAFDLRRPPASELSAQRATR